MSTVFRLLGSLVAGATVFTVGMAATKDSRAAKVTSVRIEPEQLALYVGERTRIRCIPTNPMGVELLNRCTWKVFDSSMVKLIADGDQAVIVVAKEPGVNGGRTGIRASIQKYADTMWLSVSHDTLMAQPATIILKPDNANLAAADSACQSVISSARWPASDTLPISKCRGYDASGVYKYMVQQWCVFPLFTDGKARMLDTQKDMKYCQLQYDRLPTEQRVGTGVYPVARAPRREAPWSVQVHIGPTDDGSTKAEGKVVWGGVV